jgi:O-antigen/teichoic acid export membrane protein
MTRKGLLAALAGSVGARLAGAGLGLLTQILIARTFPQSDVGTIFLTMSMAAIMSLIVTVGYPALALTELPRFQHFRNKKAVGMLLGLALRDWFCLTLILIALVFVATVFLPFSPSMKLALVFGLLSSPVSALIRNQSAIANADKRFAVTFVPDNIVRPGLFMLFIASAYLSGWHPTLSVVLAAFVFSNGVTAIVQFPFIRDLLPNLKYLPRPRPDFSRVIRRRSIAIAVVMAVATLFADIITILGGLFLPLEDVGVLGVTIRLAAIAGFFIQAAQQLVMPDLSVSIASKDTQRTRSILFRLNAMTTAVILAAFLGAMMLGRYILSIFGEEYATGYSLLLLFMVAQSIRAFSGMNQAILSISGHQVRTVAACLIAVAFLVALWLLIVPSLGLKGIGFAVIGAELAWCISLAAQAQALTGTRADVLWVVGQARKGFKNEG